MKKKISSISIVVLSLLTACVTPTTNLNNVKLSSEITNKIKTNISGKAEFPQFSAKKSFTTKVTLADIAPNATVSIIYPPDHPTLPNKTISTGLTDINGNFSINPDISFTPNIGEIFVLEAYKRPATSGNSVMTLRTYLKWNGTTWDSITTPTININSKTTALAAMATLLDPSVNSNDTIGSITIAGNVSTPNDVNHLGSLVIKGTSITSVAGLVDYALLNNFDPFQYLIYQNGLFQLKSPNDIVNVITTVTGGGNINLVDTRPDSSAFLSSIFSQSLDNNGNLYITDTNNNKIKKISLSTNIISTIVGGGTLLNNGEQATNTKLELPYGIAFDSNENLYIAESSRIRKVDKVTGIVTTIAGGFFGSGGDGGQATNAQLNSPHGIVFDSSDNLYIADTYNNKIRKVDKVSGIISTVVGTGGSSSNGDGGQAINAQLNKPFTLKFDNLGNLYIADFDNNKVRKVDKVTGVISTIAGIGLAGFSGDGGDSSNAKLSGPNNLSFDSFGNLYICDSFNRRIRKVDKITGIISTTVGGGTLLNDGVQSTNAQLDIYPSLSIDSNGNMYITDYSSKRIRKLDKLTGIINNVNIATEPIGWVNNTVPAINVSLNTIGGLAFDSTGNLYISDYTSNMIKKVDKSTGIMSIFAGTGLAGHNGDTIQATNSNITAPRSLKFDNNGNLYVTSANRIRKIDTNGVITTIAGDGTNNFVGDGGPASNSKLDEPNGIAFDNNGNLYIADSWNARIRKIDKNTGIITTVAGSGGYSIGSGSYSGDGGQATNATLYYPNGITFDSDNNMYIFDSKNKRIRKVDTTGIITTFAGGSTSIPMLTEGSMTFDSKGDIYISESNKIKKIDKITGVITQIAGNGSSGNSGDNGSALEASLYPNSILFDTNGDLYIASGNKVRKITINKRVKPL